MGAWRLKAWSFGRELPWIAPDDFESEADCGEEITTEAEGFTWIFQLLWIREVSRKPMENQRLDNARYWHAFDNANILTMNQLGHIWVLNQK